VIYDGKRGEKGNRKQSFSYKERIVRKLVTI
jgi:hypothetical protein